MPTNMPMIRRDEDDEIYRTQGEKHNAILDQIAECHERGQPVLVGTVSIEKSEELSALLKNRGMKHEVLNARHHEREAHIIADAGMPHAITIATNMAGRGTDIQLGGNLEMRLWRELEDLTDTAEIERHTAAITADIEENREIVKKSGGLYVLGTERHESRRIDNQLRGRSGRQGDPGASKFFLSLDDDLMRIFGSERMDGMLKKLGLEEGEAIVHSWINKALEKAQQKVEARNFDIRKQLLRFDDVMNDQRKVIYEQRKDLMRAEDVADTIIDMRHEVIEDMVARCVPSDAMSEQWDLDGLHKECLQLLSLDLPISDWAKEEGIADEEILERLTNLADRKMAEKAANHGPEIMRLAEKSLLLQILDHSWKEHLLQLDHLRQGIGLRAYAQRDPLNEYKREAFEMFEEMLRRVRNSVTEVLSHVELTFEESEHELFQREQQSTQESREDPAFAKSDRFLADTGAVNVATPVQSRSAATVIDPNDPSTWGKVARNAPCPCGSGKKFKHCHGRAH